MSCNIPYIIYANIPRIFFPEFSKEKMGCMHYLKHITANFFSFFPKIRVHGLFDGVGYSRIYDIYYDVCLSIILCFYSLLVFRYAYILLSSIFFGIKNLGKRGGGVVLYASNYSQLPL